MVQVSRFVKNCLKDLMFTKDFGASITIVIFLEHEVFCFFFSVHMWKVQKVSDLPCPPHPFLSMRSMLNFSCILKNLSCGPDPPLHPFLTEYIQRVKLPFWDLLPPLPPHPHPILLHWDFSPQQILKHGSPSFYQWSPGLFLSRSEHKAQWLLMTAEGRHKGKELGLRLEPMAHPPGEGLTFINCPPTDITKDSFSWTRIYWAATRCQVTGRGNSCEQNRQKYLPSWDICSMVVMMVTIPPNVCVLNRS